MLKKFPEFKRGEVKKIYSKFSKETKKEIENYIDFRKSCGLKDASDLKRYVIQLRYIIECDFKDFKDLEQATKLSLLIDESKLSNTVKPNLKINTANLLKYFHPDWMARFRGLKSFSNKNNKAGKDKIMDSDLPTDEDIEKMLKSETSIFYKTFLLIQAQTGNRTIETRTIENKNITFNKDGTATIEIFMTKTGKKKYNFVDSKASDYIKKLQEEQKNKGDLGKYLFPAPKNINDPIHKNTVNKWFKTLSKKATGKEYYPYILRHKKATQLYTLAFEKKISESVASQLMGHSASMSKTYVHRPDKQTIEILKQQAFNTEISEEKKHELEERIDKQDKKINYLYKFLERLDKKVKVKK